MFSLETVFLGFTILLLLVSLVLFLLMILRGGYYFSLAAFGLLTLAILSRWIKTGHPPVMGTHEHVLASTWIILAIYSATNRWFYQIRNLGVIICPFLIFMLGYGMLSNPELVPLAPPYQSNWLWVHVGFAWLAYGAYLISAFIAAIYLFKNRSFKRVAPGRFYQNLPELDILDTLTLRLISFGFVAHLIMIGSGAIWAHGLWGSYWGWDPIETWSLISWLAYGINLHLRLTMGWRGKKFAWLTIVCLAGIVISFGGIGFIGGLHTPLL